MQWTREYISASNNSFVMVETPLLDFHFQGNDLLDYAAYELLAIEYITV
jgi:hypothetical protein